MYWWCQERAPSIPSFSSLRVIWRCAVTLYLKLPLLFGFRFCRLRGSSLISRPVPSEQTKVRNSAGIMVASDESQRLHTLEVSYGILGLCGFSLRRIPASLGSRMPWALFRPVFTAGIHCLRLIHPNKCRLLSIVSFLRLMTVQYSGTATPSYRTCCTTHMGLPESLKIGTLVSPRIRPEQSRIAELSDQFLNPT